TYQLNDGVFVVTTPGVYNIRVVDGNNCNATTEVTVSEIQDPVFTIVPDDESCAGANDGSIAINVTNANGYTLQYSIDGGTTFQGSPNFSGLTANTYSVVVRGTFGADVCDFPGSVTINAATPMTGVATLTQGLACPAQTGIITFSGATGGSGAYQYSVGGAFQLSPIFNNLTDGTYTPQIRDANNTTCVITLADIIIDPLTPPTDLSFGQTTATCPALTADVTLTPTGGSGDLVYEIIAPTGAVTNNGNNPIFPGLTPNTYTFRVTDATGCFYTEN